VLPDFLRPGLRAVFVGTSVSTTSAERGHYYSNPTNKFWEFLTATGLTSGEQLGPQDDVCVNDFGVGLTDVVKGRASSSDALLKAGDFDVPGFLTKIRDHQPHAVAFNGQKAMKEVAKQLGHRTPATGAAPWRVEGSRAYLLPSSSGAASLGTAVKTQAWRDFGEWLRRDERG
jgi:TDG/mug DNA glycosylase family protein